MKRALPDTYRRQLHEHGGTLRDLVVQLGSGLSAASLMTSWSQVSKLDAPGNSKDVKEQARQVMERYQYSGIPLVSGGRIVGVFMRHRPDSTPRFENARPTLFLDANTGLLDLLRYMRDEKRIALVLGTADAPQGWVTYADFSKRPFRVLLFAIVAEAEYLLASAFDRAYPDDSWIDLLEPDHRESILTKKREAQHWDAAMPATTFADLGHLVHAVEQSRPVQKLIGPIKMAELRPLPDLRNRVAHVVKPIVAGPTQIATVANQVDRLLGWIDDWSERLNEERAPDPS
jgi:hypothetical protein